MNEEELAFQKSLAHAWAQVDVAQAAAGLASAFVRRLRDFSQRQLAKKLASLPTAPNQSFNSIAHRGQVNSILERLHRRKLEALLPEPEAKALDRQIQKLEHRLETNVQRPRGRPPSEKTLRRSLRPRPIGLLEQQMAARLEVIYQLAKRNHLLGPIEVNTLDSTYLPSCGHAREVLRPSRRADELAPPPAPLRTEAAMAAQFLPPDTFKATRLGYQYHLLATHGGSGQHYARRVLRRRIGRGERPGDVVRELLASVGGSKATWNLADKWFSSHDAIAAFQEHAALTGSTFLVPIPRGGGRPHIQPSPARTSSPAPGRSRSIRQEAEEHWKDRQPAEGTLNDYFVTYRRRVSLKADVECDVLMYYRSPGKTPRGEPRPPNWDEPMSYIAFYTNAHVTAKTAKAIVEMYRLRWNIENFFKDVKQWTSVAPTHYMFGRDLTFLLGLGLLSLHSLFRNRFATLDPDFENLPVDKATFFYVLQVLLLDSVASD